MVIQLNCIGKAQPADLTAILPALAEAAAAVDLDHSRLAAVLGSDARDPRTLPPAEV